MISNGLRRLARGLSTLRSAPPVELHYSHAIVRGVPESIVTGSLREEEPSEPIDLDKAREQHARYKALLETLVDEVHEIPADEEYPDCAFIEDTAVVVQGRALMCRVGHPSRRGEVHAVRDKLVELGVDTQEMEGGEDGDVRLDGGDVLFTGYEFLVGLSGRTNEAGAKELERVLGKPLEVPVVRVPVATGLHLKSSVSQCGPADLLIGEQALAGVIRKHSKVPYKFHSTWSVPPSNCLWVNGHLVHRSAAEFPEDALLFDKLADSSHRLPITYSEFTKADGALTCCSLLFAKG